MKMVILALGIIAVLAVGTVAYACEVQADVRTFYKDEFNVVHIVFAIDAHCGHNRGCAGELSYEVVRSGGGHTGKSTGTASWQASQSGSASAQAEVSVFQGEEVSAVYVTSVTCR